MTQSSNDYNPLSILTQLYNIDNVDCRLCNVDILKLINPILLLQKNGNRQQCINRIGEMSNIINLYLNDYQVIKTQTNLKKWNNHQIVISFFTFIITKQFKTNDKLTNENIFNSNNTWIFLQFFICYIDKYDYNGYTIYNQLNELKASFAIKIIKEICKEYNQKLGSFIKIKQVLCQWINQLIEYNINNINLNNEEKDHLFDILNEKTSIINSYNWKCKNCTFINRIRMINGIWIMPSRNICTLCASFKNEITMDDIKDNQDNYDNYDKKWKMIIKDKTSKDMLDESTNTKCINTKNKCECLIRLRFIMKQYHQYLLNKNKEKCTIQELFDKYINYDFEILLRDYLHFMEFHRNEINIKCPIESNVKNKCLCQKRNDLKRKDFESKKYEFVEEMYFNYNANEIEMQRLLDLIHCNLFHFEININEIEEKIDDDTKDDDDNDDIMNEEYALHLKGSFMDYKYLNGPKYKTFKDEIMFNDKFNLNEKDFNRILNKVIKIREEAIKYNIISYSDCNGIFDGILINEIMGIEHFLAIYCYCSIDNYQKPFSFSYRISTKNNKKQHLTNFYYFGRFLYCAINYFGTKMDDDKYYMQGLNQRMLFNDFSLFLNYPISTTNSLTCANRFGDDRGIILYFKSKYKGNKNNTKIFDSHWISSFSQEQETILFGEWNQIIIIDIVDIQTNQSYKKHLKSLLFLNKIINGYMNDHITNKLISKQAQRTLSNMIKYQIDDDKSKHLKVKAPKYLLALFEFYCESRKSLILTDFSEIEQTNFESQLKELLNIETLNKLFPNCCL